MYSTLNEIVDTLRVIFKDLIESVFLEERKEHLDKHPETKGNGFYCRSLKTTLGVVSNLQVPRVRDGSFQSQIFSKERRDEEIEKLVTELFIEGISTRRITGILDKCFGISLSHGSISKLAQPGIEEVKKWIERPLDKEYAAIFIDAFYFPLKRETVEKEAVYVALGITPEGYREVLGYWIPGGSEGASSWEDIFNKLKERGVESIDFVVADGLTGIQDAISRVFPKAKYQYCVIHGIRNTIRQVRSSDKEEIAQDLQLIYKKETVKEAKLGLQTFSNKWFKKYPKVLRFWEGNFKELTQFMILPVELHKYLYTTNWVERNHKETKRRLKAMEQFQNERSAEGILYLLFKRQNEKYLSGVPHWKGAYKKYKEQIAETQLFLAI